MALRDKLKERSQALLEPGEQVQQVFMAQSGMNPNLLFVSYLFLLFNKYFVVATTDRAVVVLSASAMRPSFPKAVVLRVPRQTSIGPTSGALWSVINLPGMPKPVYVHRRFYKDVAAADAGSGWAGGAAAAGAGDAGWAGGAGLPVEPASTADTAGDAGWGGGVPSSAGGGVVPPAPEAPPGPEAPPPMGEPPAG